MSIVCGIIVAFVGIATFAWYSLTWKYDFSTRCPKTDTRCISNSMLKYRRHREETKPIPVLLKTSEQEIPLNEEREAPGLSIDHLHLGLYQGFIIISN